MTKIERVMDEHGHLVNIHNPEELKKTAYLETSDKKLKEVKRQLKAEQKVSERLANDVKKEVATKKKAEEKLSPLVIENKKLTGQIAQLKKEVKELSKK